jgi:hypothetical protein
MQPQPRTDDGPRHRRYDHTHTLETMTLDGGVVSVETDAPRADGRFIVHHDGTIEAAPWVNEHHGEAWTAAAIAYLHRSGIQSAVYGPDGFGGNGGGIA